MPKLRKGCKGDSNPGSLDCESGILPPSYFLQNIYIFITELLHLTDTDMVDNTYLHDMFPAMAGLRQLTNDNHEGHETHGAGDDTRQQVRVPPKQPILREVLGVFRSGVGKITYNNHNWSVVIVPVNRIE